VHRGYLHRMERGNAGHRSPWSALWMPPPPPMVRCWPPGRPQTKRGAAGAGGASRGKRRRSNHAGAGRDQRRWAGPVLHSRPAR
jgi:hypothetical protein